MFIGIQRLKPKGELRTLWFCDVDFVYLALSVLTNSHRLRLWAMRQMGNGGGSMCLRGSMG
jgi:hypothetical protein